MKCQKTKSGSKLPIVPTRENVQLGRFWAAILVIIHWPEAIFGLGPDVDDEGNSYLKLGNY